MHFPSADITWDSSERRGAGFLADVPLPAEVCLLALGPGAGLAAGGVCLARGLDGGLPEVLLPLRLVLLVLLLLLVAGGGAGLAGCEGDRLADFGGGGLPSALVLMLSPPPLSVLLPPSPLPDVLLELLACGSCGNGDGGAGCDGGAAFGGGDGEGAAS